MITSPIGRFKVKRRIGMAIGAESTREWPRIVGDLKDPPFGGAGVAELWTGV